MPLRQPCWVLGSVRFANVQLKRRVRGQRCTRPVAEAFDNPETTELEQKRQLLGEDAPDLKRRDKEVGLGLGREVPPPVSHLRGRVVGLRDIDMRLRDGCVQRLRVARQRVDQLADRPAFRKPLDRIRAAEQKLDDLAGRLHRTAERFVGRCRDRLAATAEQLDALSPLNILKRGYSLTRRGDGTVVRAVADVVPGEVIATRLPDGEVLSKVVSASASPVV